MANSIQESINNAIDTIVNKRIGALALDKTVIGVIDSYVNLEKHIYKVKYDGGYFNARSQSEDAHYLKGMSVYVQIPQNDTTKEKLIISRAGSLRTEIPADVTISAINNFSIIGTNLLKNTNNVISTNGLGIRSYHNPNSEDLDNNTTITHRARLLFGQDYYYTLIDEDTFDVYKKDATALMIEADFRTSLSEEQKQQVNGVYGIGLDLKFYNTNFNIGETQGEVLDYYSDQVFGDITIINDNNQYENINATVKQYINALENDLEKSDDEISINDLQKDSGFITQYKSYISSIIEVFKTSDNVQNIDGNWINVLNTYLIFLDDLKNREFTTKAKMIAAYQEWRDEPAGPSKFNDIAFVLDSNSMTGNPYNYSNWSTQYAIFSVDMETLAGINNILFYKEGFIAKEDKCTHDNTGKETPREDIFVKNVKIYALKPISAENGDYRLEISSPDGLVFNSLNEDNTLDVVARVSKAYYQDLTENSSYLWFKKNKNVTTVSSNGYHQYGGIGWKYLPSKGNRQRISLIDSENLAYENTYKCVALLDETIVLAQEFYVYNFAADAELKIQSNLGVNFNFDAGIPTLTCLVKMNNEHQEITDGSFHYSWAILINGQRTFLTGQQEISSGSVDITEITNTLAYNNLIKGLKFYKGEEEITENLEEASRILYPISNIGLENAATFECYVEKQNNNTYYDIGCATLTLTNKSNSAINGYRIVIENGDQVFQYDEYGNSPVAKKLKNPLQIKPLICHLLNPIGIEVPSGNYTLNWILPISDSMLVIKEPEKLIINPATNLREINNTSRELLFDIAELYNENLQNNQITCQVVFGGNSIVKNTNFLFTKIGENGTNGTDVVARIFPRNVIWKYFENNWRYDENNTILDKEPLTLYRSNFGNDIDVNNIMNLKAEWLTLNNGRFSTKTNNNYPTLSLADETENNLCVRLYLKNQEIPIDDVKWNIAGATKTTINDQGKYIITDKDKQHPGKSLVWTEDDDDVREKPYSNYILRAQLKYGKNSYYAFYPLCIINYPNNLPKVNRLSIDKQFLLKEIMYNADGRNPVYVHSQGIKINNLPKDGWIEWSAKGGLAGLNDTACAFKLITTIDDKNGQANIITEKNINYIYILPDDDYGGTPSNHRVEAIVKNSSGIEIAKIVVPIYMHLNTFGLASFNDWDGNSVTVDEDGGYIAAPRIGAGEKDDNNRLTGIVMGRTETYTGGSENESEVGLFGYVHGLQSIFLDAKTGNATFGLPDVNTTFDAGGNPIYTYKNSTITCNEDNYSEGRIELRPGDVSSIGGWRIGRRSLFYATAGVAKTINGKDYSKGAVLPTLDVGNEKNHEKDIGHQDSGILLAANNIYGTSRTVGNNPYISLKGRPLTVWDGRGTKPSNVDIDNSTGNSPLTNGNSLELQLDPQQSSIFTIYRHYEENGKWTRSPMVGINAEGCFYSNALQNEETSLNLNYVPAFGKKVTDKTYTGLYIGTTGRTFFKAFVNSSETSNNLTPLRITGGLYDHEYDRPITLHGKYIDLYANNNNDTTSKTTNTKLTLNNSSFYAGNTDQAYITLPISGTSILSSAGNLGLYTNSKNYTSNNTTTNDNSYLYLAADGNFSGKGNTGISLIAHNGDVNLRARINGENKSQLTLSNNGVTNLIGQGNVAIYANGKNTTSNNDNSYLYLNSAGNFTGQGYNALALTAYNGNITMSSRSSGTTKASLILNNSSSGTSTLTTAYNFKITSEGNKYSNVVGSTVTTELTLDTNSAWTGAFNHPANETTIFKVTNSKTGGFQYMVGLKPDYSSTYRTNLKTNYARHSSALTGTYTGNDNTNGGIVFNWGLFPGRIFEGSNDTTNANYVNTSIYAKNRIVTNRGFKTTQDSSSITMKNHTIKKKRTDWGYTSTPDITGDNLYTLLEQLLDEVAYALNYAKSAYARADAAYSRADAAYNVGNHDHPYASNSHTHSVGTGNYYMYYGIAAPYVVVNGHTYNVNGISLSSSTGGVN